MNNIKLIEIDKIKPNPLNPRKDLGDLTELADSIRSKGIMQNLTVVPDGDSYMLVIGHRRHAASKLAGLTKLPCVVRDMTEKEQAQIMLMENIQRNELTVYEQAQGFQIMLDLGSNISDIAKETGFSETTVRHRLKLNDLDPELLREKSAKPISITDYIKLEQIKDPELRNEALKAIGTANFDWEVENAKLKEKENEKRAEIVAYLEKHATRIDDDDTLGYDIYEVISRYELRGDIDYELDDPETIDYFFAVSDYSIHIYTEADEVEDDEEDIEAIRMEEDRKERVSKLNAINTAAYNLRREFIKNISNAKCKAAATCIVKSLVYAQIANARRADKDLFGEIIEFKNPNNLSMWSSECKELMNGHLGRVFPNNEYRMLAIMTYTVLESQYAKPFNYDGRYEKSKTINSLYDYLIGLGYEISVEEKAFVDGSHELYCC